MGYLNVTAYFCPEDSCLAVIGTVLVCKDGNHITRTYLKTLTPVVQRAFFASTCWEDGK